MPCGGIGGGDIVYAGRQSRNGDELYHHWQSDGGGDGTDLFLVHRDESGNDVFDIISDDIQKIGTVIALPFFVALIGQKFMPKVNDFFCRIKGLSFYLWAMALTITLGQTIDFMFLSGRENLSAIIWLGIASVAFCAIQFGLGKFIGYKYGDIIAGGQLLGQKNSAMGIWMANTYLNPLASIFPAMYSIWQNLFNSIQLWWHDKKV